MNLLQCEICQITRSFLNTEVAYNYAVDNTTIMSHKNLHSDELIENIHYFYDFEQTKGGRQRVIKWTLEGVYKLFDKIKKLKERSKMAEEKESKGSYNLQIKIPNELKDKLEKKAEKAGVSLNQYIMYLFIDDIKNERI
ncbi:toxin-antitoxin system HicB family antitoxin [Campylobacter jejuni]|uniref:toxin-antitoxin system HicB family antitoxin n=1 Tax=Campylobacter jejuni TaxID=197 RepID=UPI002043FBBD|nr:toxin-antitoxin system HicB family antitoxin [Campylobacter jejuni]